MGGYPKSGTTLLCALLDAHPDLLVFPEEIKFLSIFSETEAGNVREELSRCLDRFQLFGRESAHSSGYRDYRHISFSEFWDAVLSNFDASDGAIPSALEAIMLGYQTAIGRENLPVKQWVEKTPQNEKNFDLASSWWPKAKLIVMIRDPREALLSHRRYQVKAKSNKRIALGDFVRSWLDTYNLASDEVIKDSSTALIVLFESLVADREKIMREVAGFINVGVDPALFEPTKAGKNWEGNSSHGDSEITDVKADILRKVNIGKLENLYISIVLGFAIIECGYTCNRWLPRLPKRLSKAYGKLGYAIQFIGNLLSKE